MIKQKQIGKRELFAVVISSAMVITAIVYWIIQIDGVMAMFKLAAGG
jgi:hypothetical protein